jgi:hypothetical protein
MPMEDVPNQLNEPEDPRPRPNKDLCLRAREFISNLPDNPMYKSGTLRYPPHGLWDIAGLMAAFSETESSQLIESVRGSLEARASGISQGGDIRIMQAVDTIVKREGPAFSGLKFCPRCGSTNKVVRKRFYSEIDRCLVDCEDRWHNE